MTYRNIKTGREVTLPEPDPSLDASPGWVRVETTPEPGLDEEND